MWTVSRWLIQSRTGLQTPGWSTPWDPGGSYQNPVDNNISNIYSAFSSKYSHLWTRYTPPPKYTVLLISLRQLQSRPTSWKLNIKWSRAVVFQASWRCLKVFLWTLAALKYCCKTRWRLCQGNGFIFSNWQWSQTLCSKHTWIEKHTITHELASPEAGLQHY